MRQFEILPSILAADHGKFVEESHTVDVPEVNYLHIDVMDGHFVPNVTFGPKVVASLRRHTRFQLDVHLMIENVDHYIPHFADAGAHMITIHQEATHHLQRSLQMIRDAGVRAGVALNPATGPETLRWVLDDVDHVLIMSVNPGFGGQSFLPAVLEKIRLLDRWRREEHKDFLIEIDGGIDQQTAPQAYLAGCELLVAGSAIFGQPDRPAAMKRIREAVIDAHAHHTKRHT